MYDHAAEVERRIVQFTRILDRMAMRRRTMRKDDCWVIFNDGAPAGEPGDPVAVARAIAIAAGAGVDAVAGGEGAGPDGGDSGPGPGPSRKEPARYVQFLFERKNFLVDLPQQTLARIEAEKLLRVRSGFYFMRRRKDLYWHESLVKFDPVRKIYLYGDERCAAEDMAYVLFDLWKFPVDSRLSVCAACFKGQKFEQGVVIE